MVVASFLTLVVQDNGQSFDPESLDARGNGLPNMRRRLQHIGGRCEITGGPGEGVKILFVVPMDKYSPSASLLVS